MRYLFIFIFLYFVNTMITWSSNNDPYRKKFIEDTSFYMRISEISQNLNLKTKKTINKQFYFRLWYNYHVIELWKDADSILHGEITSFVYWYSRNYNKKDTVYIKHKIPKDEVIKAIKLIFTSDFFDIPDTTTFPKIERDCETYSSLIEYSTNKKYYFQPFYSDLEKTPHKGSHIVHNLITSITNTIQIPETKDSLITILPKSGGYQFPFNCGGSYFHQRWFSIGYHASTKLPYGIHFFYYKPYFFKHYFPIQLNILARINESKNNDLYFHLLKNDLINIYKVVGSILIECRYRNISMNDLDVYLNNYGIVFLGDYNNFGFSLGINNLYDSKLSYLGYKYGLSYSYRYFTVNFNSVVFNKWVDFDFNITKDFYFHKSNRVRSITGKGISLSLGFETFKTYKDFSFGLSYVF